MANEYTTSDTESDDPEGLQAEMSRVRALLKSLTERVEVLQRRMDYNDTRRAAGLSQKRVKVHESNVGKELVLHFDGASKNNPGLAGAGWTLTNKSDGSFVAYGWKFMGYHTNNEAEYEALIVGLGFVTAKFRGEGALASLDIFGDSNLIVQQVTNKWKCNSVNLKPYLIRAQDLYVLATNMYPVTISHIPREQNSQADHMSNVAIEKRNTKVYTDQVSGAFIEFVKQKHHRATA